MANILKFNVSGCSDGSQYAFIVDDPLSAITSGGTYYFEQPFDVRIPSGCYNVINKPVVDIGTPTIILGDSYTNCLDCINGSSQYVLVGFCPPS